MVERTVRSKPLAATAKRLSKLGLATLLSIGLAGQPGLARTAGMPARPVQIEVLKAQGLEGQARAIQTQWQTHFKPESAPRILDEKNYQGQNDARHFFSASTDLTRLMATYPDWLAGEHFAQASRFILEPGVVSKMNPLSTDSSEFNAHIFKILKRAAFMKGKGGVSPHSEFGGRDASEKLREFYHKLDPVNVRQAAEIYSEAFKEYSNNDVFWDSVFIKYSLTPTSIVDLTIAKHLKENKSEGFADALNNATQKDRNFVSKIVIDPSAGSGIRDSKRWNDAFWTYLMNYGAGSNLAVTMPDERDIVVSHGYITPESPSARYSRLAVFYNQLAKNFLDEKGDFKRGIVDKKDLQATAQMKISVLQQKIAEMKQKLEGEQSKPRKDALTELISDFEKRAKSLQDKYVK